MRETPGLRWARRAGLTGLGVLVGVPLYALVTTSIKPLADVDDVFRWLPSRVTLRPYVDMWSTVPLSDYLLNSLVVAVATTVLSGLLAVPAAYAVARGRFRARAPYVFLLLAVQAAPGLLFLVPLFLLYAEIGDTSGVELIGTYPGLVLADLTFVLPFATWLLANHIRALPRELEDAARVDGAGPVRVLLHVVVPTAAPGIAVVGLFAFLLGWGEVLFASVLAQGRTRTLPVGLHDYATQSAVAWNELTAAALVSCVPVLVCILLARRLLPRGFRW